MNRVIQRKVVDKDMLDRKHRQGLIDYLEQSPDNQIVITDYLLLESVAGNAMKNFCTDFSPLKRYSHQMVALKPLHEICALKPNPALAKDMICSSLTHEMRELWRWLPRMELYGPDRTFQAMVDIYQDGRERVLETMGETRDYFISIVNEWPTEELNALRHGVREISSAFGEKLMGDITSMARLAYAETPDDLVPPHRQAIYSYQFRFSLCCVLLVALNLVKTGLHNVTDTKLRSHLIDMSYTAYATFFDGVLSHDNSVSSAYEAATIILSKLTERYPYSP